MVATATPLRTAPARDHLGLAGYSIASAACLTSAGLKYLDVHTSTPAGVGLVVGGALLLAGSSRYISGRSDLSVESRLMDTCMHTLAGTAMNLAGTALLGPAALPVCSAITVGGVILGMTDSNTRLSRRLLVGGAHLALASSTLAWTAHCLNFASSMVPYGGALITAGGMILTGAALALGGR